MDNLLRSATDVLALTAARWAGITQTLSTDLLYRAPALGEWSALECLQHLVDTETVFQTRTAAFLAGRNFEAFNPDSQGSQPGGSTPADLAAEFARRRAASLETLARLAPADLDRPAIHQELGRVTFSEMLNEWAAHDLMHTVQAERALMQPFIQDCGPWRKYFSDHDAAK